MTPVSRRLKDRGRDRPRGALFLSPKATLFAGVGFIAGIGVAAAIGWWCFNGFYAGDTLTYWLAGTRVNVGHEVYSVRPDDPWLFDIRPYGLYSPPFIVVPWRVLAALPGTAGMIIWWLTMAGLAVWAIAVALIGTRGAAGFLILPLIPSLTLLVGVGNVDAAILAGIVATWMLAARGREVAVGVLVAGLVSLKLTPAVLLIWLLGTRRWRALVWALATLLALAVVTAVVLGPDIFAAYAGVVLGVSSGNRLAMVVIVVGLSAVLLLGPRHERLSFALAVALMPLGSPVTAGHSWAVLVGCTAPWLTEPGGLESLKRRLRGEDRPTPDVASP